MKIRAFRPADGPAWRRMREALWADCGEADHVTDLAWFDGNPEAGVILIAEASPGQAVGFAEVGLRNRAEGCISSPVGYLEGWYVEESARRRGIGRALVVAAEQWAEARGCREFASDAPLANRTSLEAHRALGFSAGEPTVPFHKVLSPGRTTPP